MNTHIVVIAILTLVTILTITYNNKKEPNQAYVLVLLIVIMPFKAIKLL